MKALLLNSSYRITGNTATALSAFENEFMENGYSVEKLNIAHQNVKPCRGCRVCFDSGEHKCPIQDDVPDIYTMIQGSDIVIFATPIYVEDVNGIMKNLIDRLAFNSHRPKFFNQYAYIILTSGIGATNHGVSTLRKACHTWGFHLTGYSKFVGGAAISEPEFARKYGVQVKKEVKKIITKSCKSKTPTFLKKEIFYLLGIMVPNSLGV